MEGNDDGPEAAGLTGLSMGLGLGCCAEGRTVQPMDGRENDGEGDGKTVGRPGEAILAVAVVRTLPRAVA